MRSVLLGFFALSIGASFYWFVEQNWISLDPIMHARNKRLFDPSSSLSNLQGPVKKIGFLKTHKTASSTIQNILLRYGLNHNLTFVLPSSGNYLTGNGPRSEPFQEQWLNSLPWHRRFIFTHQYDIIALHTRWNFEQFRFVLGSDAVFFTILRDPSEVFESLFTYASFEEAYQINITEYLRRSKDPFYRSKRLNGYLGLNQQLWDLGVNLEMSPGKNDIKWHIERLDQQFDLVLITDLIDESLVLLAQLLRVPLSEMVSLKINARKKDFKLQLSKKDQTLLKKLQSEEMQLYTHFRRRLLRQIQIFGRSKMRKQVKTLQMLQQSAYEHCVLNETDKDDLEGTPFEPYHKETVAYRVREDDVDCVRMAMAEVKFIDLIRDKLTDWWKDKVRQQRPVSLAVQS